MAVYRTVFPIEASAEAVWEILTDFDSYGEMEPIAALDQRAATGRQHRLADARHAGQAVPEGEGHTRRRRARAALAWHGNAGADRLFAGDREFLIDQQPDGTVLFTHTEDVHGALFPLFRAVMGSAIQRSHDAFNAALKERAEARAPAASQ